MITRKSAIRGIASIPAPGIGTLSFVFVFEVNRTRCGSVTAENDFGIVTSLTLTFDLETKM